MKAALLRQRRRRSSRAFPQTVDNMAMGCGSVSCRNPSQDNRPVIRSVATELLREMCMAPESKETLWNVYVVLLDPAAAKDRRILKQNPNRDPLKPCVYVGLTGLTVHERFANHKNGHKASWVVKRYGNRLLSELYQHLNPMP